MNEEHAVLTFPETASSILHGRFCVIMHDYLVLLAVKEVASSTCLV